MRTLAFVLAFVAAPLSATWFEVSPAAPVTSDTVSITFITDRIPTCGPNTADVTFSGRIVRVHLSLLPNTNCLPDVNFRTLRVDIGTLAAGEYTLTGEFQGMRWEGRFVVRTPNARLRAVPTSGSSPVSIDFVEAARVCPMDHCTGVTVLFGDTPALTPYIENGILVARTPPHERGLYDIKAAIQPVGPLVTFPNGIYFFDPAERPDPTVFEPVLFPVLDSAAGALGSRWTTIAAIENATPFYVETFNRIDKILCVDRPCSELLAPRYQFEFSGLGHARGAVLYIPRLAPESFAFSLRVKETSRGDDPGVEIQPVRESRLFRRAMTLVNVPVGEGYRTKLRIYGVEPVVDRNVSIGGIINGNPSLAWSRNVTLDLSGNLNEPAYAELDLQSIPELRGLEKTTITVAGAFRSPMWAFASAVHNETQRMVIVSPQ